MLKNIGPRARVASGGLDGPLDICRTVERRMTRQHDVDREGRREVLASTPVDEGFAGDIADLRADEGVADNPWARS